jgi:hypothetical protein
MDESPRVPLPEEAEHRLRLVAGWIGLAWCALYGWFSIVRGGDVPVLWFMQLAVHEVGHRVFAPFGDYTMYLMGSGSEILVPLLIGIGCIVWRSKRDLIAAGMCGAVAAGAFVHTAAYMADAPRGEMTLIGGGESDWLIIFDRYWDALYKADVYAARMRTAGLVVWLASVGLVVAGMVLISRRAAAAEHADEPVATATPRRPLRSVDPRDMWR